MASRLAGKVAVVSGSARGIGKSIAGLFASEGAKVLLVDVETQAGEQSAKEIKEMGGEASFFRADISDHDSVVDMAKFAKSTYGNIHILCQNAAIFLPTSLDDMTEEVWDRVISVNLKGAFLTVKACMPLMKAQNYGSIVITSSITGPKVGCPGMAHYSASKAGIIGFIRTAAIELAKYNITINAIEPGEILTEQMKKVNGEDGIRTLLQSIPLQRLGDPLDVAYTALFLASEEARYITGQSIVVDGGIILPESRLVVS
jgi:3-oxoacyl-[acyl-carrier protein] reductase